MPRATNQENGKHWSDRALPFILLVIIGGLWELLSRVGVIDRIILPAPSAIIVSFWKMVTASFFPKHFTTTMEELVIGYVLGSSTGLVLGIATGTFYKVKRAIEPFIVALASLPKVVLAPLMLIWFGYGISSKVALVIISTLFPVYINTIAGLAATEEDQASLMRAYVATPWQTFTKLTLPNALAYIFTGLKNALTLAFVSVIVAEFVGATRGLGVLVNMYNESFQFPFVFAVVGLMVVIGVTLFALAEFLDRKVVFWRGRK